MNLTLWDLIEPLLPKALAPNRRPGPQPILAKQAPPNSHKPIFPPSPPLPSSTTSSNPQRSSLANKNSRLSAQDRYDQVVDLMLSKYQIRVRKWRKSMSGIAWYVTYSNGKISRLIESPRPKGPMSMAIFLHEVGHHAIGFNVYKPRCLEEFHAWRWSLEQMESLGLNITDEVRLRVHESLHYAIGKATRRGIKHLPAELAPYVPKPAKRKRARRTAI